MRNHLTCRLSTFVFASAIGIVANLTLTSCKHELPININEGEVNSNPSVSPSCSPDTIYFANTIQPLLNSSCALSGCHDATSRKEGVELTSYSKVLSTGGINKGNPNSSKLYTIIIRTDNERMPPPPSPAFTTAQKEAIYKWILQGARNNSCNACDTALYTYATAIRPLINTYCQGCHNPASLGGGIDLSTYVAVNTQAGNGKLIGSITHASGYQPMPKGGSKLSACQIKQVEKWIAAGSLNN